jgi:hypothetical protein
MSYARKVVLSCPHGATSKLDDLVEEFIRDGVIYVGVVGNQCAYVEDLLDEIVVGDGDRGCSILTASHPGEPVEEAVRFARALTAEFAGDDVQTVELPL